MRAWLRTYAKDHPRRGFRPAYHDARGEGWVVNHKKIQRLWCEEGAPGAAAAAPQTPRTSTAPEWVIADAPDRVWAVDFQSDATIDGRPIKIVSIVDEHTRECLGGLVERSITGEDLIAELDRVCGQRGTYPTVLRCDNGPELARLAMAEWADGHVGLHFIPSGQPWRNGYVESFNSRIRDECLNINSLQTGRRTRCCSRMVNPAPSYALRILPSLFLPGLLQGPQPRAGAGDVVPQSPQGQPPRPLGRCRGSATFASLSTPFAPTARATGSTSSRSGAERSV